MRLFKKKRKWDHEIEPDEIFLDSQNIPQFNTQQLEGRFEKPISKRTIAWLGVFLILIGLIFSWRLGFVQIARGEAYFDQAEKNSLSKEPIFSERGVIYDRNDVELAWNIEGQNGDSFPHRSYIDVSGLGHILGFVSYPSKDSAGFYWQEELVGKDGVELSYDELLSGENGLKIIETNVFGEIQSENVVEPANHGENIILSIDSRVQNKLFESIASLAKRTPFTGGAGIILDVNTGEILALTNFPEYDPEILSSGKETEVIARYVSSEKKPFLNRAVVGLYTPGSTVKPFLAIGALNEGVISPNKKILSTGSISIPNPYFPDQESVFKDWKAHGWVDMIRALAVSSNVYFYEIGGGYENQRGLGIANIEKYVRLFGLGDKTGVDLYEEVESVIPNPEWKARIFDGDPWRIGDTYNTAIGQYGFQVTPLQLTRAMAAIANYGTLVTPHLVRSSQGGDLGLPTSESMDINEEYFTVVHKGLRQAVTQGTGRALYIPGVKVAAKTGTAQIGTSRRYVNSWVTGFFPYENPRFAFTVLMERGPASNTTGAVYVMRDLFDWMVQNTPEYLEAN